MTIEKEVYVITDSILNLRLSEKAANQYKMNKILTYQYLVYQYMK